MSVQALKARLMQRIEFRPRRSERLRRERSMAAGRGSDPVRSTGAPRPQVADLPSWTSVRW